MNTEETVYCDHSKLSVDALKSNLNVVFNGIENFNVINETDTFYTAKNPTFNGKRLGIITPYLQSKFGFTSKNDGNNSINTLALFMDNINMETVPKLGDQQLVTKNHIETFAKCFNVLDEYSQYLLETLELEDNVTQRSFIRDFTDKNSNQVSKMINVNFRKKLLDNNGEFKGIVLKIDIDNGTKSQTSIHDINYGSFVRCALVLNTFYISKNRSTGMWELGYSFTPTQVQYVPGNSVPDVQIPDHDVFAAALQDPFAEFKTVANVSNKRSLDNASGLNAQSGLGDDEVEVGNKRVKV